MKKILIVEDEPAFSTALLDKLAGLAEIHVAEKGGEAVIKGHQIKPNIVILDLFLPQKSGLEILDEIKTAEWGKEAIVIILTALMDDNVKAECMEKGATEYLLKSDIKINDFVNKIENYLK